jgi:uncharacterized protein
VKVVFDTNIFISAFVIPGGSTEKAVLKIIENNIHLVISKAIIQELLDVLARKFGRDAEELARTAVYLSELGEMVSPKRKIKVLKDDPDNRILECAVAGRAEIIVTGDKAMLQLGKYEGVRIITLKEFLQT